jgi:hypothetical protein
LSNKKTAGFGGLSVAILIQVKAKNLSAHSRPKIRAQIRRHEVALLLRDLDIV